MVARLQGDKSACRSSMELITQGFLDPSAFPDPPMQVKTDPSLRAIFRGKSFFFLGKRLMGGQNVACDFWGGNVP